MKKVLLSLLAVTVLTFGLSAPASAAGITFTAGYIPTTINVGNTSVLTFNVVNTTGATLTGVTFTDTLPAGLSVASPNNINGFCTGGSAGVANGNSGGQTTSLLNTTLTPSGGSCQYSITILASQAGVFTTSGLTVTGSGETSGVAPNFSLTVNNVPEPTSASLLLMSLAGTCWTAIRRSRKA